MSFLRSRIREGTLCVALVAVQGVGAHVVAQGSCTFGEGTLNLNSVQLADGSRITYVTQPRITCTDGVRLQADSAVAFSAQNMSHLMGNVRFSDATRELRSDDAQYFSQLARLQAHGSLFVRDTQEGSVIENGDLLYLREGSVRTSEEMTVRTGSDGVRPRALLTVQPVPDTGVSAPTTKPVAPAETAEAPLSPYVVEADVLFFLGDGYFRAGGEVVIERDSLLAYADSAEYDRTGGRLVLQGSARVDGAEYDLSGRTIVLAVPGGDLTGVRATGESVLIGADLRLTSPVIEVVLENGSMDRLVAVPLVHDSATDLSEEADLARPTALADDFQLVADSIDVDAPAQVVERIFATGNARSESTARDSLNVESLPILARTDWLEGDTIIATFAEADSVPLAEADSNPPRFRLDRLVAHGRARSLYRLLPADSTLEPGVDAPAIHFVMGSQITVVLDEGEVDRLDVEGETHGWHLEPQRMRAGADTAGVADPAGVTPDTAAVVVPPGDGSGSAARRRR